MKLKIANKTEFVNRFLNQLSKINTACALKVTGTGITSLLTAADNTLILFSRYNTKFDIDRDINLNIPDLNRLSKMIQCIPGEDITLDVYDSVIKYESKDVRFQYYLLDDGIIETPPLSEEKIKAIEYNTNFELAYESLVGLIKSSSFVVDIHKVYFYTKDGSMYAEVNDKKRQNIDNICLKLADKYSGDQITTPLPMSLETIRLLGSARTDKIDVLINNKLNVMMFGINNNDIKLTYIVSGLVK
jgi:hypothetical protein|tara:strand:+ start:499 stop:1233 length:735 start_codon:yes stop_codon:yes gene_type:complete